MPDELWRTWLEANGRADNIYLIASVILIDD
jgi:hypothetical protein